jgi:hypothetical protein
MPSEKDFSLGLGPGFLRYFVGAPDSFTRQRVYYGVIVLGSLPFAVLFALLRHSPAVAWPVLTVGVAFVVWGGSRMLTLMFAWLNGKYQEFPESESQSPSA